MELEMEKIKRSLRIKKARELFRAKGFPVIEFSVQLQSAEITETQLKDKVFQFIKDLHLEDAAREFQGAIKAAQDADPEENIAVHAAENFIIDFAEENLK
jgi:hypothetical protein